jgi:hypothetical protein
MLCAGTVWAQSGLEDFPESVDPQSWVLPEWMTWDDYQPIPGVDWTAPENQPVKKLRAALVVADFADRDFIITQPRGVWGAGACYWCF